MEEGELAGARANLAILEGDFSEVGMEEQDKDEDNGY